MQSIGTLETSFRSAALNFLEKLATPRALTVAILIREEEWDQLVRLKFNPTDILVWSVDDRVGASAAKRDYQATEMFRKAQFLPSKEDLDQQARNTFFSCEAACALVNRRLDFLHPNALPEFSEHMDPSGAIRHLVGRIRKDIKQLLGPVPDQINPAFGPGSIFEVALHDSEIRDLTVLDKLDRIQPAVTAGCTDVFKHFYNPCAWGRIENSRWEGPQIVRSNRFATVIKDATKHRVIGVEPGGNIWLQKGVGTYLRSRLQQRWGLLLPEGKSEALHHQLAKLGSKWGHFATIDLSNASDTIARILVELLLPPEWYELLDAIRVKFTQVDGKLYYLEKFSSMGNGFTFELETLIFAAIARSLVNTGYAGNGYPHVSVYGDDIIVPAQRAEDVIAALKYFGFTPNQRKTFVHGYFRESCGGDFVAGYNIAPFRITSYPTEPQHFVALANSIHRTWDREDRENPAHDFWHWVHNQLPVSVRKCQGPTEYGDVCVHWNEPRLVYVKQYQSLRPRLYRPWFVNQRMDRHDPKAILAYALLGGDPEGPVPRGKVGVGGFKVAEPKACTCKLDRSGILQRCATCSRPALVDPRLIPWELIRQLPVGREDMPGKALLKELCDNHNQKVRELVDRMKMV